MGLWSLLLAASTPVVQVLLMGLLGAYLASGYSNILLPGARRDMNKVVFTVFTPALLFANLAKTVTFQEIISWWFMPVNIGITFLIGGILGWIVVKILRPPNHIEGLVIAACSAGNLGNLLLIIIPAICEEDGNPFGNYKICSARGISYVSFSMALGAFYIWTHSYSLMRNAGKMYHATQTASLGVTGANEDGHGVSMGQESKLSPSVKAVEEMAQHQVEIPLLSGGNLHDKTVTLWDKTKETLHKIVEELLAPPTAAAIVGFVVGAVPWLKSLFIGSSAPLKVVQDSMKLLGDGTVPCITLILGGNLTQGLLGAYLASGYSNLLPHSARRDMNKVVFTVFTPSLTFASLAKTVTLKEITSWWFMPVNLGITFLIGGILGWIVVRILRPPRHLEGLVIATCSAGNMGNLLWIIIPAICEEDGNPFGNHEVSSARGLASFSMADIPLLPSGSLHGKKVNSWHKMKETLHSVVEELLAPPTVASIMGVIVGATPWLKSLFAGSNAPLRVVEDTVNDGTVPCITLVLGGNLTQGKVELSCVRLINAVMTRKLHARAGLRRSVVSNAVIVAIVCVRYLVLPVIGIAVVRAAYGLGLVPYDPLYRYVLMIRFGVPPAMNIGTMARLFDVGQEECSVIFLWTYVVATVAVTGWSTLFMWISSFVAEAMVSMRRVIEHALSMIRKA
ncbi:Membrane transport protein, partial [Musa troglodytarum]